MAFFINNIGTVPIQKNKAQKMNYKIKMIKIELFFLDRLHGVIFHALYYNFIKPIFGIIQCWFIYIFIIPVGKIIKSLFQKTK